MHAGTGERFNTMFVFTSNKEAMVEIWAVVRVPSRERQRDGARALAAYACVVSRAAFIYIYMSVCLFI